MKNKILFIILLCSIQKTTLSQLKINNESSIAELVQTLVGKGITTSNIKFNGKLIQSSPNTCIFADVPGPGNKGFGIVEGIALSTITSALISRSGTNTLVNEYHPNAKTAPYPVGNEPDLEQLATNNNPNFLGLHDAAILEFDFIPNGNGIEVKFVFASDEYPDHVCSSFNDVFGFFLSGPGILGPYENQAKNIALIPNSNLEISINTINNGYPGGSNDSTGCKLANGGSGLDFSNYFVSNLPAMSSVSDMLFQGFTVPIMAKSEVICGEKYHIKLAIADVSDGQMNSTIFLEKQSFKAVDESITLTTEIDSNLTLEGCSDVSFQISRKYKSNPMTVLLKAIGGSAQNLIDFNGLPDSVVIPKGKKNVNFTIDVLSDYIIEPVENTIIQAYSKIKDCKVKIIMDTTELKIIDKEPLIMENKSICLGASIQLEVKSGGEYSWYPIKGLNDPNTFNPVANPDTTTIYTVKASFNNNSCPVEGKVKISVEKLNVNAGNDITICAGDSALLEAMGNGSIYSWEPREFLTNPNSSISLAFPNKKTLFTVTSTDTSGQCISKDEVWVSTEMIDLNFNSNPVCLGNNSIFLNQSIHPEKTIWHWDFENGAGSNERDPIYQFLQPREYSVKLTGTTGNCTKELVKPITVYPTPKANFNLKKNKINSSFPMVRITDVSEGALEGNWNFGDGTEINYYPNQKIINHEYSYLKNENHFITLNVINEHGCEDSITKEINILREINLHIPNSFTPNNDGINDIFSCYGIGLDHFNITIYNRWGEKVFESNNMSHGWDGDINGIPAPQEVYVWKVNYSSLGGKPIKQVGHLNLLR